MSIEIKSLDRELKIAKRNVGKEDPFGIVGYINVQLNNLIALYEDFENKRPEYILRQKLAQMKYAIQDEKQLMNERKYDYINYRVKEN